MKGKPDFESLVERHSAELFAYLWRLLGDESDANDCLQDAYLRAYRAYERVQDLSNLRAWLYKIATNVARTQLARRRRGELRNEPLLEPIASGEAAVEAQVAQRTQLAAVRQAVAALPARQQAALLMRKYQNLEYAEIAAALDCSEEAARANVYHALKKLRTIFAEADDE